MNSARRDTIGKLQVRLEQFDRLSTDDKPSGLRLTIQNAYGALKEEFEAKWADLKAMCDELVDETMDIAGKIKGIKDEEQEAFDNMPESLQSSERGQLSESAINALDEAFTAMQEISEWSLPDLEIPDLDEVLNHIDDVISHLEEATSE